MLNRLVIAFLAVALVGIAHVGWKESLKDGRFPLSGIRFEGIVQTKTQKALERMSLKEGTNLLTIDPKTIKEQLEPLPWVRNVEVRRVFPGSLTIQIKEKIPVCLGVINEKVHLLDEYGVAIKVLEPGDPLILPVVRPAMVKDAAKEVVRVINLLGRHPWLKDQISEAVGFAGGRWTLYTMKGVKVLLSENADKELELLMRLQKKYKILDRKIRQVELRIPGKAAVRLQL